MKAMPEDCYTFKPKSKRIIKEVAYEADKMENMREDGLVWAFPFFNTCFFIRPRIPHKTDQYGHYVLPGWVRRSFRAFIRKPDRKIFGPAFYHHQ